MGSWVFQSGAQRRSIHTGHLCLQVASIYMVFKAMKLDEITQEDNREFKRLHPGALQSLEGSHGGRKAKPNERR